VAKTQKFSGSSGLVSANLWFLGTHGNKVHRQPAPWAAEVMGCPPSGAGTRYFAFVKAHLSGCESRPSLVAREGVGLRDRPGAREETYRVWAD
jgi:hypothetical protein